MQFLKDSTGRGSMNQSTEGNGAGILVWDVCILRGRTLEERRHLEKELWELHKTSLSVEAGPTRIKEKQSEEYPESAQVRKLWEFWSTTTKSSCWSSKEFNVDTRQSDPTRKTNSVWSQGCAQTPPTNLVRTTLKSSLVCTSEFSVCHDSIQSLKEKKNMFNQHNFQDQVKNKT